MIPLTSFLIKLFIILCCHAPADEQGEVKEPKSVSEQSTPAVIAAYELPHPFYDLHHYANDTETAPEATPLAQRQPTTKFQPTTKPQPTEKPEPVTTLVQREDHDNPRIAIIIDDIGYSLSHGTEAARIDGALTLAVLPHSPNGAALAQLGHQQGKEIILHTPMSTIGHDKLDAGGLSSTMDQATFEAILLQDLQSIPHVSGLNNHMGSQLTQLPEPMHWLMTTLARKKLFFIDSRTSADSIALQTALANQVPARKRDVFLDNERTADAINQQLDKLIQMAHERGSAVAIGHPYPETLAALEQALPKLAQHGVVLVPVSDLLPIPTGDVTRAGDVTTTDDASTTDKAPPRAVIPTASQTSTPRPPTSATRAKTVIDGSYLVQPEASGIIPVSPRTE